MSHFKAENAPNSISSGAVPQTPLGKLTALPRPPSWFKKVLLLKGGEGLGKEREGRGNGGRRGRKGRTGKGRVGREGTSPAWSSPDLGSTISGMPSGRTNNFPESGRGLGHVTPTIFGIRSNISAKLLEVET